MSEHHDDPSRMSNTELVQTIGAKTSSVDLCRTALGTLYRRFAPGVFAHIKKVYGHLGLSEDDIRDLVTDTFMRFKDSAGRFDASVAKTPEGVPKLIRCWMKKHAKWAVLNHNVAAENRSAAMLLDPELPAATTLPRSKAELTQIRRIRKYLHARPEKAQDVLRTSIKYYDDETRSFRVPREIQDSLMQRWGFATPNALVQYRLREFRKLTNVMLSSVA